MKKLVTAISKISYVALLGLLAFSLLACTPQQSFKYDSDPSLRLTLEKAPAFPEANFVVLSDPHIYDPNLGMTGQAFEDYLAADRKLLRESGEILDSAVASISDLKASFVLVPGDLSKDGERQSHLLAAQYLAKLKASGKKIYVVPGNHDIKNGHSYRYTGSLKERMPNITAEEFVQIYSDYGYKDALQRDSGSLSYLAEPEPGLWLLALDSCRYKENVEDEEPITDGKFSPATLQWIEEMLIKAASQGKAVMVMMHHGIVEHYVGQEKNYGQYIVDDYETISKLFADYNVRMVFTGHYHAQDITEKRFDNNKFIFDIETGSLVTYPCPYRVVKIGSDQNVVFRTGRVTSISSHPQDFSQYARDYLEQGISGIATKTLMGYKIDRAESEKLGKQIAQAFIAHYAGDENLPAGQNVIQEQGLSPLAWIVIQFRKDLVYGLWNDPLPPDNNLTIDLKTGNWQ